MSERQGYRGYIATRPMRGSRVPQHVQNLAVRDHAQRNDFDYLLSAVEYAMPGCFMVLETVLEELPALEGVICYSLFMLPEETSPRREIYRRILDAGCTLHGAVENIAIRNEDDIRKMEDIFMVDEHAAKLLVS